MASIKGDTMNPIIFGHDTRKNVVNVSIKFGRVYIYTETDGEVKCEIHPFNPWLLANEPLDDHFETLEGQSFFKYIRQFRNEKDYRAARENWKYRDIWASGSLVEQYLIASGVTYFKESAPKDIGTLFFDIETTGLTHDVGSRVLLISNTFRKNGQITKKLFAVDDYPSDRDMLCEWVKWVKTIDPSIIVTYNGWNFDIPYLMFCAWKHDVRLTLGRDGSEIEISKYKSKFRQDQNRTIEYAEPKIFGREQVDLFFTTQKYDVGKKFTNYRLKTVVREAGLEKEGRQFYDAGLIFKKWHDPAERAKIKQYAIDDADDTMSVYDLVIDGFFYPSQNVPKPFQTMCMSASGSQINSMLLRAYLAVGHSIPKASEKQKFQGAISKGYPGIYKSVHSLDVASLYPSIILTYNVVDKEKDPNEYVIYMVKYFREQRLVYKKLAAEGSSYYKAMDAVAKAFLNSFYGFYGTKGLHFSSPHCASEVTRYGREILTTAMDWANSKGYNIVLVDTDSIKYYHPERELTEEETAANTKEVNALFPSGIKWDDEGIYKVFVVVKSKNYIMVDSKDKVKLKGSSMKSSKLEPSLKDLQKDIINMLIGRSNDTLENIYATHSKNAARITDIKPWSSRKTISERTIKSERRNERLLVEALAGEQYQLGDKFEFYYTRDGILKLSSRFQSVSPDHDVKRILGKIYKTCQVFANVTNAEQLPNYTLSKNAKEYNDMVREKVLKEKIKKLTAKTALEELLKTMCNANMEFRDSYDESRFEDLICRIRSDVFTDKPKKPRAKKNEGSQQDAGMLNGSDNNGHLRNQMGEGQGND
jgi:DNA polymerase elongation subunit (family B)